VTVPLPPVTPLAVVKSALLVIRIGGCELWAETAMTVAVAKFWVAEVEKATRQMRSEIRTSVWRLGLSSAKARPMGVPYVQEFFMESK